MACTCAGVRGSDCARIPNPARPGYMFRQTRGSRSGTIASPFMGLRSVLVVIVLLTGTGSALAQGAPSDDIAKGLYGAAKAEYDAGQFDKALLHFQEAYAQSKRPQLLYNVGLAADRLRYNKTALEAFERYLRELPDAENKVEVENRINALREIIDREAAASRAPAAVAAAAPVSSDARTSAAPPKSDQQTATGGGLLSKWWFWTAAGVVVAGATTGIIIASSGDTVGKPLTGTEGVVVQTLRVQ